MKTRIILAAALAAAFAMEGLALPGEFVDWANGPAAFLMTKEESAAWRNLRTDDEARDFVALFWARRDPSPGTPRNEFREEFERRVAFADKNLQGGSAVAGSLTDQGKALILYGPPKRILRSSQDQTGNPLDRGRDLQEMQRESRSWVEWIYEDDPKVRQMFLVPRASIRFVDKLGRNEFTVERGTIDLAAAQARMVTSFLSQPDLKQAPTLVAEAPAAPAAPAAVVPVDTALSTETFRKTLSEFDGKSTASVSWGEYVTAEGTYYVPVLLSVPAAQNLSGGKSVTFFGRIDDAAGKQVASFERAVSLSESKGDFFVDHAFEKLPAGKYRGVFGVADGNSTIAVADAKLDLSGTLDPKAPGISQLILSNNIYPLPAAQAPTEPFAFGGLKVVPKGDATFRKTDDLWFFVEIRNPGIAETAVTADVVPVTGTETAAPVVQVKLDVEGVDAAGQKIRRASPPREVNPVPIKGVPGHYGVGDSIPLASFKPGQYTMNVKLVDTVSKVSYTLSRNFSVVE